MKQTHSEHIRRMLKGFDDVFHTLLIAMERLEAYLEIEKRGGVPQGLKVTAINSDRDHHNDSKVIPTRESFLSEVQLDCTALVFQTEDYDPETYRKTATFFLTDLLEWFAGRSNEMDFNEVDAYALPILVILSRSVTDPMNVVELVDKYVTHIRKISEFTEAEQERAVRDGMNAYLLGQHHTQEQMAAFIASGADVELTAHQRGSVIDGYKRLFEAFTTLYKETLPAKTLIRIVKDYMPEVANVCSDICESNVENYIAKHHHHNTNQPINYVHENNGRLSFHEVGVTEDNSSLANEKPSIIETVINYFKK